MFDTIEQARLQALHLFQDEATQLRAVIAIHNTRLGPALGGCRFLPYPSDTDAIKDAIHLAQGMSYKAALAGLPLGGGKAVIIKPHPLIDRAALLQAFGRCVAQLNGQYITSVDSGSNTDDMDEIAKTTHYVTAARYHHVDPSPNTALGVLYGIQAALAHHRGRNTLQGVHVAIQGVGNVGKRLAERLHEQGATLTLSDTDLVKAQRLAKVLNARWVASEDIVDTACDVFAPCGLGGTLNRHTVARLRCQIVAGAANNQLTSPTQDDALFQRGILYAPDFVINAGGLIQVAHSVNAPTQAPHAQPTVTERTQHIGHTLRQIFTLSAQQRCPTGQIATTLAKNILYANGPASPSNARPNERSFTPPNTPSSAQTSTPSHAPILRESSATLRETTP